MVYCSKQEACVSPSCTLSHPCVSRRTHPPNKWLPAGDFKRNTKKRFLQCKDCSAYGNKAVIRFREAKLIEQEETEVEASKKKTKEDVAFLCHMPRVEELEKEEAAAIKSAEKVLAAARHEFPGRIFSINVFGASTGTHGFSVQEEGLLNLSGRGRSDPAIVAPLDEAAGSSRDR